MRVRHLLVAGIVLTMTIVVARLAVLGVTLSERDRLDALQWQADRASRDSVNLLVLGQDYLLHGGARAARQWRSTSDDLVQALTLLAAAHGDFGVDVAALRESAAALPALFAAIESVTGDERDRARRDLLADQLAQQTRNLSESGELASEQVRTLRRGRRTFDRDVTLYAMGAFAVLVLLIAAVVSRRMLRPAARLEAAASALRAGDLGARSRYRSDDEFGALSRAFDEMADALQARTASLAAALRDNEASEAFLARTGRVAGVGGWEVDLASGKLSWSREARRIHEVDDGYAPSLESTIGFYAPEVQARFREAVRRAAEEGVAFDLELPFDTASGRRIWVRKVGETQYENGVAVRISGALQDITERKALEQRLGDGEAFLRKITDGLPVRIAYLDAEHRYRFVNQAYCRRFGREREAIVGRTAAELDGTVDAVELERMEAALAGREQAYEHEQKEGGEPHVVETRLTPDADEQGSVKGVFATSNDITARKHAELEARATSSLLQAVLGSASEVSIIAGDPELNITVFNAGAERLLGYRAEEIVGKTTPILIHDRAEVEARARELSEELGCPVEGGAVFVHPSVLRQPREWTYVRKDGSRVAVSLVVTAMHGDDGSVSGYLGIAHDVTRQKQYEESLRRAMHEARHANAAKSQFLANMSHEIRTPMNAVIGLTYLLGKTGLDRDQASFLAKIELASNSLLTLINDILDLSKVEAGELTIERVAFKPRHVLHDLAEIAGVQADARGISFALELGDDLPHAVTGDPTRLAQVLTNLISNAIKFTERGGVVLRVDRIASGDGTATLRFAVRDTGIGIARDVQDRLFTPFIQADTSVTRRFGGTGLGLSIVKRLVELMNGRLTLESTPGVGSEFGVELPMELADLASLDALSLAVAPAGQRGLAGVRILVVDDSDINREVARRILELEGARVELAEDGRVACDRLAAAPDAVDVVLMDVQMPVLDGYEATKCIRSELGMVDLPIIALTAAVLSSELERATRSGMNGYVSKPFEPKMLVRAIRAQLRDDARLRIEQATSERPASEAASPGSQAAVGASREWLPIDGVDIDDARNRLSDDWPLFCSMLARLLDEFGDATFGSEAGARPAVALAARMHKLKGSAGMLAAHAVQHLAGEAEIAARRGDAAGFEPLVEALRDELAHLRRHAEPVLRLAAAEADSHEPADAPALDASDLARLIELLRRSDLAALEVFDSAAPRLRRSLGDPAYATVRKHVDDLKFDAAASLLAEHSA